MICSLGHEMHQWSPSGKGQNKKGSDVRTQKVFKTLFSIPILSYFLLYIHMFPFSNQNSANVKAGIC